MSIRSEPVNYYDAIGRDVADLRIGIPRQPFFEDLDPEIAAAIDRAIAVLRAMTGSVTDVSLPSVDSFPALAAEIYAYHAEHVADPERRKLYQPLTLSRILEGANVPLPAYIEARRQMAIARNTVADVFAQIDLLVTPTTMALPDRVDDALAKAPEEIRLIRNTLPFNVFAIPTISVPCGFTRGGLPIGLQISGPRLDEARVLTLAHAYEQATEWHLRRPALG